MILYLAHANSASQEMSIKFINICFQNDRLTLGEESRDKRSYNYYLNVFFLLISVISLRLIPARSQRCEIRFHACLSSSDWLIVWSRTDLIRTTLTSESNDSDLLQLQDINFIRSWIKINSHLLSFIRIFNTYFLPLISLLTSLLIFFILWFLLLLYNCIRFCIQRKLTA